MTQPPQYPQPQDPTPPPTPAGPQARAEALTKILTAECGELTEPEKQLARAMAHGEECDLFRDGDEKLTLETEQDAWHHWGEHRTIRASVIRIVCISKEAQELIDPRGIRLLNARITGELNIQGAIVPFGLGFGWCAFDEHIIAHIANMTTLNLRGSRIPGMEAGSLRATGSIFLGDGFHATGEVLLLDSTLGASLNCSGGRFNNGQGRALSADRLKAASDVFLTDGFHSTGDVRLLGSTIGGNLACRGGRFDSKDGHAIIIDGAQVTRVLFLGGAQFVGVIDLAGTRIACLHDRSATDNQSRSSWPERILLTDCRYDALDTGCPLDAKSRLAWLANHDKTVRKYRQPGTPPDPGPYRQLAGVLRKQGHERDADAVMERLGWRRLLPLLFYRLRTGDWWTRVVAPFLFFFSLLYGIIVGHGYARFRPLLWLLGFWLIGAVIFGHNQGQHMQPTQGYVLRAWSQAQHAGWTPTPKQPSTINAWLDEQPPPTTTPPTAETPRWVSSYPKFNPWVYALDTFLPLVDFHQEEYWTPRSGWWAKDFYLPFHIISGWVIATLFAASFTRLARQD